MCMRFTIDFIAMDDNVTKYLNFETYWKSVVSESTGRSQRLFVTIFEIKSDIFEWLTENQINYKIWTPVTYTPIKEKTKITDWQWNRYIFDFDNQSDFLKFQLRWL